MKSIIKEKGAAGASAARDAVITDGKAKRPESTLNTPAQVVNAQDEEAFSVCAFSEVGFSFEKGSVAVINAERGCDSLHLSIQAPGVQLNFYLPEEDARKLQVAIAYALEVGQEVVFYYDEFRVKNGDAQFTQPADEALEQYFGE